MESLAYLVNRHFILVAVDKHYQIRLGKDTFKINNAKKVYKLNDWNFVALVGDPYKTTNISKYLQKLNEYGHNQSFKEIVGDVMDVFNSTDTDLIANLKHIVKALPSHYDSEGHINLSALADSLKDKPELISLLNDALNGVKDRQSILTQIFIAGWNTTLHQLDFAHLITFGANMHGNQENILEKDFIYLKYSSSSLDVSPEMQQLEMESIQAFNSLQTPGWDENPNKIIEFIELGKKVLADGIKAMCPYDDEPEVIYYELSYRSDYKFIEPDVKLIKIEVARTN